MNPRETSQRKVAENVGTLMFLAWTLVVGIAGFVLLCAIAFAIVTENLALGLVCGLLLFAPPAVGIVWILTAAGSLLAERSAPRTEEDAEVLSRP